MKVIIIFTLLFHLLLSQGVKFEILPPSSNITLTQASAQACYANCKSCQTLSNKCEQCYDPYFVKSQDGSCQLDEGYILQSSNNEMLAGNAFIYTTESWGNIATKDCSPNPQYLDAPLKILGPFSEGTNIVYQRSISFHQYIVLSFLLVKMGWTNTSELRIDITNENDIILNSQTIIFTPNIANETLCSSSPIDQRFAVSFQIADISVTTFKVKFTFVGAGSWGIATWAVITGSCDSTCSNCSYSREPTQCIGCNSFFIMGSNSRCSQCFTGFKLTTQTSGIQTCQKCQIEYQNCNPGQEICYYNNLASQLNSTDCTFATDSDYSSTYDVDQPQFPGSLFTVASKPATYQCGPYSIVGLAQVGDGITRIFATMKPHYLISVSFNIFVVDQSQAIQNNLFVIIVDNMILQASYITTQGVSNLCGNPQLEAFVTFPATKFYPHNKTNNVNLTITSNAVNWGIRNLRLSFQVCDETCLKCGPQGCLQCQGYFTLDNLKCTSCPDGFGKLANSNTSTCSQCPQNCLLCSAALSSNSTKTVCLQCSSPFFLFQEQCVKRTNIADTINVTDGSSSNGNGSSEWNVKTSSAMNNKTCIIDLPLRTNGSLVNFTVSQNLLTSLVNIKQPHYKKIVQFYLIKIDDWDSTDLLQLYLNDLLVLEKNYSHFGNNICFNSSQNDLISYQSIEIEDSNSSLSISFQVVTAIGAIRRFGVSNFQVFPKGCQNCNNYPFSYKLDYNYDNSLNVHLEFNRVYVNNNETLFKQIFQMFINGNKVGYSIVWNNSIVYKLQSYQNYEVVNANLTVICKFPELVQAKTDNSISSEPFFTARLLQSTSYQNSKIIDNNSSYQKLQRYSPPPNASSANGMRIFFEVVSRTVIYLGFVFFFFGCQTTCTHFMHNLQKIWLHIFVAALAAPSALRFALIGFAETQGQNIAIHPTSWESGLPTQLYYNTPSYFQQYYTDIGFFRNIYNIAIAFVIFIVLMIVANLVLGKCNFSRNFKDSVLWRHLRITFVKRPFFVLNSIIFYQYLSLVLACTLQFTGFMNKTNVGAFGGINAAGAVIAFILATIYPLFQFYFLQRKRSLMKDTRIQYANRYGQIYYRFLPTDVWAEESIGITYAEQIYNLYRFGQIWWMCIVATLLYKSPQAQCFLLLITNLIHLVMILFTSLSNTLYFKLGKVFQLAFFAGLQILILVCQTQQDSLTSRGFNTLGSVGIALVFAIVFLSFVRSIYTFSKIYGEYSEQNVKIRNEDYFSTKGQQPIPSERDN